MIRIGFLLNFSVEYKGGINYLKNLFFAIKKFHSDRVEVYLFVPENIGDEYVNIFKDYATIVPTKILQRKTLPWFIARVTDQVFRFDFLTHLLLKKYQINVISHSGYLPLTKKIKSINWIPDFQYLHYPNLWTEKQLAKEHDTHRLWVTKSDLIVVSSNDALQDLLSIYPNSENKVRVVHFVSQPDMLKNGNTEGNTDLSKYSEGPYFYLPNQFWEHKNHIVAFKAVKLLKDQGINIHILTSGLMNDFRCKNDHVEMLKDYVVKNGLESHIKLLGLIPYSDVLGLIKKSLAVINPSFFEGWSSTVEEAKSIGKIVVLSNINVHKEQNPENGFYFNPKDEVELAKVLKMIWLGEVEEKKKEREELISDLENRTEDFADNFVGIVDELSKLKK